MMAAENNRKKPLLVVVGGPTASGKTPAAITLALHFGTEILSADSRQCFRELNIGVAKPTPDELSAVPHHFINSHSIHDKVDAAVFEQYGLQVLQSLFNNRPIALVAGGTGLYIKALCEGVDPMPEIPDNLRWRVRELYKEKGLQGLLNELRQADPVYFAEGETQNPQRVMRALEFSLATGHSIRAFQQGQKNERPFRVIYLGMDVPRPVLHQRINARVDDMMKSGLAAEVQSLMPFRNLNALQTVGYNELFDHFDGKITLAEAVDLIKTHTRQYAKRQVTWFKKTEGIQWVAPAQTKQMIDYISTML